MYCWSYITFTSFLRQPRDWFRISKLYYEYTWALTAHVLYKRVLNNTSWRVQPRKWWDKKCTGYVFRCINQRLETKHSGTCISLHSQVSVNVSKPNKSAHIFRCINQRFETKQSGTCISLHQSTFRNQTMRHMYFAAFAVILLSL